MFVLTFIHSTSRTEVDRQVEVFQRTLLRCLLLRNINLFVNVALEQSSYKGTKLSS